MDNQPKISETELMNLCASALGPESSVEWGAFFRTCIRGNGQYPGKPEKVRRVMLELDRVQKEGRIKVRNPGAFAYDLYKRFSD